FVIFVGVPYRVGRANQTWRTYPLFLLSENRWRAMRYGVAGTLFDFGKGELVAFRDLADELLGPVRADALALGCLPEIEHAAAIVRRGTSADRQGACFERLVAQRGAGAAALARGAGGVLGAPREARRGARRRAGRRGGSPDPRDGGRRRCRGLSRSATSSPP